jgi:hypothetical protein
MVDYLDHVWIDRARAAVANGKNPYLRNDFHCAIEARVEKILHRGESRETARSRFMRTDPDSDCLWDAMMMANER